MTARKLAGLMAAAPVSLPVVHLIQQTLLQESTQVHVAEVFMSGLIRAFPLPNDPTQRGYDFLSDTVRDRLGKAVSIPDTLKVIETISAHVSQRLGLGTKSFRALIALSPTLEADQQTVLRPFAELAINTLEKLGSDYCAMAQTLKQQLRGNPPPPLPTQEDAWPPLLTDFPVDRATVEVEEIVQYEFETATIAQDPESAKWVISKTIETAWGYREALSQDVQLNMVEITGGTFTMGSPKSEPESSNSERPQHEVTLQDFAIGQTPVTQAQWRVVAGYPPVNPEVEFKENPSQFEGDDRPVEKVNWYEAKEFCDRLSAATGKTYDLPTEAEWEYACRAGTTTPFSFGEMITTELANYDGNYPYNGGTKGEYREQTTPVGTFPANAWGLYDMHGNVREWCLDHWHNSYEEKPEELRQSGNTAWLKSDESKYRLLRGGSWVNSARNCRSASRDNSSPDIRYNNFGFRVVCRSSRTR
ncbi:MAG: SUMF1/EgtB/PvdO family nonheme iron enzyme [Prochlorotrichaceae cyanobacterium]